MTKPPKPPIPPPPFPPDFPLTGRPGPLVGQEFPMRLCLPLPGTTRQGKPRQACDTRPMVVVAPATPSADRPGRAQVLAVQKGFRYLVPDAELRKELRTSASHRAAREAPPVPTPSPAPRAARPPRPPASPPRALPAPAPERGTVVVDDGPRTIRLTYQTPELDAMEFGPWQRARRALLAQAPVEIGWILRRIPVTVDLAALDAVLPPFWSATDAYGTSAQRATRILMGLQDAIVAAMQRRQAAQVPIAFEVRLPGQTPSQSPYQFVGTATFGPDPAVGPVAFEVTALTLGRSCERYTEDWKAGAVIPEAAYAQCDLSDAQVARDTRLPEHMLPSFPNPPRPRPPRPGFPRRVPPVAAPTYANPLTVRVPGAGTGRYLGLPNPPPGLPRRYANPAAGLDAYPNPPKGIAPGQSYVSSRPDPLLGQRVVGDDFTGVVRARAAGCKGEPAHVVGGVLVPAARVQGALRRAAAPKAPRPPRTKAAAPVPAAPVAAPRTPLSFTPGEFPPALLRLQFTTDDDWWEKDVDRMRQVRLPDGTVFELPWEQPTSYNLYFTLTLGPAFAGLLGATWLVTPALAQAVQATGADLGVPVQVEDVTAQYAFVATLAPPSYDHGGTFTLVTYQRDPQDKVLRVVAVQREVLDWQKNRYQSGLYGDREVSFDEVRARAAGRYVDPDELPPVTLHPAPTAARLYQLATAREVFALPANLRRAVTPAGHPVNLPWEREAGREVLPPVFAVPRKRADELGDVVFFLRPFLDALGALAAAHGIATTIEDVTDAWVAMATTAPVEYDEGTISIRAPNTGYLPPELRTALASDPRYALAHPYRVVLTSPARRAWQASRYASGGHPAFVVPLGDALTWTAPPPPPPVTAPLPVFGTNEPLAVDADALLARYADVAQTALAEFPNDAPDFGGPPVARADQILHGVSYSDVATLLRDGRVRDAEAAVRRVEQRLDAARAQVPMDVAGAFLAPPRAFGAMFGAAPAAPVPPPPPAAPRASTLDEDGLVRLVHKRREAAYAVKHALDRDTKGRTSKIPKARKLWDQRYESAQRWIAGTDVAQELLNDRTIPLAEKEERIKALFLDLNSFHPLQF